MRSKQLQSNEWEVLTNYRLTTEDSEHAYCFSCTKLLNEAFVSEFIEKLKEMYGVNETFVAASQFIKRYAYMVTVPYLYSMSMFHKRIDIGLEGTIFQSYEENKVWLPKLQIQSQDALLPTHDRASWRAAGFESLFKDHLAPVISMVAKQGKISKHILWENAAVYVFWIYESMMKEQPKNEIISDDFNALLAADCSVFGDYSKNPIHKYYTEKKYYDHVDTEIRLRKTCCLYNRLPGSQGSCSTCPQACQLVTN
ncbi:siderophore-iron reductase FhuF [Bacillus pinisoli]|uniref:siderophore-iron reductase FhuF n=1 Tax=Bacillus pinisoli TaxID=2901866 RepID=UPI001FF54013|nr:siderophore-iron reductase FhuF [Bacillus pinisoli]